jgi:hypothetical protein
LGRLQQALCIQCVAPVRGALSFGLCGAKRECALLQFARGKGPDACRSPSGPIQGCRTGQHMQADRADESNAILFAQQRKPLASSAQAPWGASAEAACGSISAQAQAAANALRSSPTALRRTACAQAQAYCFSDNLNDGPKALRTEPARAAALPDPDAASRAILPALRKFFKLVASGPKIRTTADVAGHTVSTRSARSWEEQ